VKFVSKLSNHSLICNELQVKDYKELLKCIMGDKPDVDIFVETFVTVLSNTTNRPTDFIRKLSIIDLICLLIDVRYNSLGACKLVISNEDKKINLELNLETSKMDIAKIFDVCHKKVKHGNIEVELAVPSLMRLHERFNEEYIPYIANCTFQDINKFEVTTNEQAVKVFDLLPPKFSLEILSSFSALAKEICTVDLLKHYNISNQQLIVLPTIEFLIWLAKLLFNEPLSSFYDNLFGLSFSGRMNAEYVENLPVGEYNYFMGLLKQTLAPKDNSPSNIDQISNLSDGL
jgi:hypothetical protein